MTRSLVENMQAALIALTTVLLASAVLLMR